MKLTTPVAGPTPGFTLLEILLVVVIISILSVVGVNLLNSQSIERVIMDQAQRFEGNLNLLCEQSVFQNQAHGIEWLTGGYQVLRHQQQNWQLMAIEDSGDVVADINITILLDGADQILTADGATEPHIICQTDGSFNAFELQFRAQDEAAENYYALKTDSPWQLTGGWHPL